MLCVTSPVCCYVKHRDVTLSFIPDSTFAVLNLQTICYKWNYRSSLEEGWSLRGRQIINLSMLVWIITVRPTFLFKYSMTAVHRTITFSQRITCKNKTVCGKWYWMWWQITVVPVGVITRHFTLNTIYHVSYSLRLTSVCRCIHRCV